MSRRVSLELERRKSTLHAAKTRQSLRPRREKPVVEPLFQISATAKTKERVEEVKQEENSAQIWLRDDV